MKMMAKNPVFCAVIACLVAVSFFAGNARAGERYLLYNVWTFTADKEDPALQRARYDAASEVGFNAMRLSIYWPLLETSLGHFDFTLFDRQIDYAVQKGLKVAISINLQYPNQWPLIDAADLAYDAKGTPHQLSLVSPRALARAAAATREVVRHYAGRYPKGFILFYQVTFTRHAESEYWHSALVDYSAAAQAKYRQWLGGHYGTIQKLNTVWGASYASFNDIKAPAPPDYNTISGLTWYLFRTDVLRDALNMLGDTVHKAAPGVKYGVQWGSVWDSLAPSRATILFPSLCQKAEWVTVDDAPTYNHNFSSDLLRGSVGKGRLLANEIDNPRMATDAVYSGLAVQSFDHGLNLISVANWGDPRTVRDRVSLFRGIAQCFTKGPGPVVGTLEVSALQLLQQGEKPAQQEYQQASNEGSKVLDLVLVDDITPKVFPPDRRRKAKR